MRNWLVAALVVISCASAEADGPKREYADGAINKPFDGAFRVVNSDGTWEWRKLGGEVSDKSKTIVLGPKDIGLVLTRHEAGWLRRLIVRAEKTTELVEVLFKLDKEIERTND